MIEKRATDYMEGWYRPYEYAVDGSLLSFIVFFSFRFFVLFSLAAPRLWRVPVLRHLKHLAVPSASLAVQSAGRSKAVTDPRETSLLTPRESMRRSTFYDEDLGEVVDLSGHGTWVNANLSEIIQDLVDALSALQTVSEGHEERFAALGAVQKTAKEQASGKKQRTTEQTREFTESLLETASQESGHQVPDSTERPGRINASVLGHDQPEWLASVLGRLQTMEASIAALSEAAVRRSAVAVADLRLKPREDVLLFSSPRDSLPIVLLQAWRVQELSPGLCSRLWPYSFSSASQLLINIGTQDGCSL